MELSIYKQAKRRQQIDDRITYFIGSMLLFLVWLGGYVGLLD